MVVLTKAGALTPTDSNAGGIQLSDSSVYDEVLVFDRVLTGTEKTQINDYLTNKWGLNTGSGSVSHLQMQVLQDDMDQPKQMLIQHIRVHH